MIEFREMTLSDFDDEQFINSLFNLDFVSKNLSVINIRNIFETKRSSTDTYIVVDTEKNQIIGHVAICAHYSFNCGIIGAMYDMSIDPSYRGQGIGKQLLFYARQKSGEKRKLTCLCGPVDQVGYALYSNIAKEDPKKSFFTYFYPKRKKISFL